MAYEQTKVKKGADASWQSCSRPGPVPVNTKTSQSPHLPHFRAIGNEALQRMLESGTIQAKLKIGQPNDKYEQEADSVADQVMRMPDRSLVQRESTCPGCTEEDVEQVTPVVQKKCSAGSVVPGPGQPMPRSLRSDFENRFGHDFSHIRIHTDNHAADAANAVNARAYTYGNHLVFGAGEYNPGSRSGCLLIAHELTHAVQQSARGRQQTTGQETGNKPGISQRTSTPIVSKADPEDCTSGAACETPDGTGGPKGKFLVIVMADREGTFLAVPLTSKVGHSWIKLVDDKGNYWTYGFWPEEYFEIDKDVPGCVHKPDTLHTPSASQTIELTAAEFAAVKAEAIKYCKSPPPYNLFGLQCTEFVRRMLAVAGKVLPGGFGLIWESPNALQSWLTANALLIGINIGLGGENVPESGNVTFNVTYRRQLASLLENRLRLFAYGSGEIGSRYGMARGGFGFEFDPQAVFLPSLILQGGGTVGDLRPGPLGEDPFGAGPYGRFGMEYNIDEIIRAGVGVDVFRDLLNKDPAAVRGLLNISVPFY